jgi:protein MAK11
MWNLVKGRCAYIKKLPKEAVQVLWSFDGMLYATVSGSSVTVHSAQNNQVVSELVHPKRVNSAVFVNDDIIATGGEDKIIRLFNKTTGEELHQLCNPEENVFRIRSLQVTGIRGVDLNSQKQTVDSDGNLGLRPLLVSVTSHGIIQVW